MQYEKEEKIKDVHLIIKAGGWKQAGEDESRFYMESKLRENSVQTEMIVLPYFFNKNGDKMQQFEITKGL